MSRLSRLSLVSALWTLISISQVLAQPCLSGFRHRVPITVDNSSNGATKHYEVRLELNTAQLVTTGKMQRLGQDIRFLDKRGNPYAYWIEDGTMNSAKTGIWIKIDSLPAYSVDTLYMYYGNTTASAQSNERATFHLVDQFNGSTLGAQWSSCGSGTIALSRGKLNLTSNANKASISSSSTVDGPVIIEMTGVSSSGGEAVLAQVNNVGDGYAMHHNGTAMQMHTISQGTSCFSITSYGPSYTSPLGTDWSLAWQGGRQLATWGARNATSSNTTNTRTTQTKIILANIGAFGTLQVDYIRVRGYLPNVPALNMEAEQSTNFTLAATYNSPLCEGGDLQLQVNQVVGATYKWTGPNGFSSNLQNPQLTGVRTSDAGRYDLTVELPTGCATKTASVQVTVSPKAVGGSLSGAQTVCEGSNSGTLVLSGYTGSILRWDSATSANGPWSGISNTTLNHTYNDLSTTTYYRAIVTNSGCSVDSSNAIKIEVTPATKGGQVTNTDTVCAGSNAGVLTLNGQVGNVLKWELSTNGNFWQSISNKGTTNSYSNLTQTTYYRAAVQNGNCNIEYSALGKVNVDQQSVGGTVLGSTTVCPNNNSGWVTVYGNRGTIMKWESSNTGTAQWSDISTTNDSVQYAGLKTSKDYRVVVKNGACPAAISTTGKIQVLDESAAGTISGAKIVCASANAGTLTLNGYTGTIEKWQSSLGSTWTDIQNTKNTFAWTNLSDTTSYRVIVSNQGCEADTSAATTVWVNEASNGGYLTGTKAVCATSNTVDIKSNAIIGDVVDWESSPDGKAPWTSLQSNGRDLITQNITSTTYYRVKVKNGVCHADYSDSRKVHVDAASVSGQIANDIRLCAGSNLAIMRVIGSTGDIIWYSSSDSTSTSWSKEAVSSDRIEFHNLNATKYLRTVVQNGTCQADTSAIGTIEVFQQTRAGVASADQYVCGQTNSGFVTLNGHNGNILKWQSSTNQGRTWLDLSAYADTLPYTNLTVTTWYRATVQNGVCPQKEADATAVHIASASQAGTLIASISDVCETGNTGQLSLAGKTGEVVQWLSKSASTGTFVPTGSTTNTYAFTDLTETTEYKAVVQNDYCPSDTSNTATITVHEITNPGQIVGASEVCENMGTTILSLAGNNGQVLNWRSAITVDGPWVDLGNTTKQHVVSNSGQTEFYSVVVQNGVCPTVATTPFVFTRHPNTKGGIVLGGGPLCRGQNEGTLELTDYVGQIKYWEVQDPTGAWVPLTVQTATYNYKNIAHGESYRAVLQSGTCPEVQSTEATITMNELPDANVSVTNPCAGQAVAFEAVVTSTDPISTYAWNFADGFSSNTARFNRTMDHEGPTQVVLRVETNQGCYDEEQHALFINESPKARFVLENGVSNNTVCLNTDISFNNSTIFSDPASLDYAWSFGDGQTSDMEAPIHRYSTDGDVLITLNVTTRQKCSNDFTLPAVVLAEHKPSVIETVQTSLGIPVQLKASGSVQYAWTPEALLDDPTVSEPNATVIEDTKFIVTGTDYYGCTSSAEVMVIVEEDYTVLPNNIITNNGGSDQAVWTIKNIENYPKNKVFVFDRWGREVFATSGYRNEWDATNSSGNQLPDGVYYYLIEFPEVGKIDKGAINIIRGK